MQHNRYDSNFEEGGGGKVFPKSNRKMFVVIGPKANGKKMMKTQK